MRALILLAAIVCGTTSPVSKDSQRNLNDLFEWNPNAALAVNSLESDGVIFQAPPRKHCFYTYGTQPGFPQGGQGCARLGASACGGPDQCYCGPKERLVTFKCGGAYYHMCWALDVGC